MPGLSLSLEADALAPLVRQIVAEVVAQLGEEQAKVKGNGRLAYSEEEASELLGLEPHRFGFLDFAEGRRRVREALAVLGHAEIRPESTVAGLSPATQQLVEIARALLLDVRLLVLDEPTSSLTRGDAQRLFALVRRLKERGVTIVYISHFLEEVREIADRFTVLRDGRQVGSGAVADTTVDELTAQAGGSSVTVRTPRRYPPPSVCALSR